MIANAKPLKPKTCKNKQCKKKFVPVKPMQSVCGWECAAAHAETLRIKREASEARRVRKETKEKLVKLKSLSEWLREVQRHCNLYVRLRDANEPCISCGRYHQGQYHAGHYRTTKAAPHLRFNLDNIHKQCQPCNAHLSGNITEYRPRLMAKIGAERLYALENNNEVHRYTIEEAKELLAKFRGMCRELEREQIRKAA